MAYPMDPIAGYYTPYKGQPTALSELQNYQPYQSFEQIMLKVILNRLKSQAEEIILKNKLGLEPEGAPLNRSSTLDSCVKSTSNISRICIMSS